MPKKRVILLACATVVAAIATLAMLSERTLNLPSVPVGITFVGNPKPNDSGNGHAQPTFWVTNHTSKILCVTPWEVATRQGTSWTQFQHRAPPVFISPHAAADVTIDF